MRPLVPSLRNAVLAAALAVLLGACAPGVDFGASLRADTNPRGTATRNDTTATVTVTARAGVRIVVVPDDRPARGLTVRPAGGRPFDIPPGHYPPPGSCRAWVPGVPPGRQAPPGPCPQIERDLPDDAYLVYG